LKANGNTPADSNMFTRCEMGPAKTLDPILRTATGIPSVPSAEVVLSPVMIFEIRPAFTKSKEKEIVPLLSPLLGVAALSRIVFNSPAGSNFPYFLNIV
jgi:hypothetical protein